MDERISLLECKLEPLGTMPDGRYRYRCQACNEDLVSKRPIAELHRLCSAVIAKAQASAKAEPTMPSVADQFGNLAHAGWDFIKSGAKLASPEERARRLAICNGCGFFDRKQRRCSRCGCFVDAKSFGLVWQCPIGKWVQSPRVRPAWDLGLSSESRSSD